MAASIPRELEDVVRKCESRSLKRLCARLASSVTARCRRMAFRRKSGASLGQLRYRTSFLPRTCCSIRWKFRSLAACWLPNLAWTSRKPGALAFCNDIGKAVDRAKLKARMPSSARILPGSIGEHQDVVHAIAAHHEDIAPNCALDVLVQAADSISGRKAGRARNYGKTTSSAWRIWRHYCHEPVGVMKAYAHPGRPRNPGQRSIPKNAR